mmetsp:Transcript_62143/g.149509  ORF Transcript_62143/g.149509 Transcript_62143/m.149509 type:complete len:247 (-) Transcript_62143:58-798(-)
MSTTTSFAISTPASPIAAACSVLRGRPSRIQPLFFRASVVTSSTTTWVLSSSVTACPSFLASCTRLPAGVSFCTAWRVASPTDTCLHPTSATISSHSFPLMLPGGPVIAHMTGRFLRSSARRASSSALRLASASFAFLSASAFASSSFNFRSASSCASFAAFSFSCASSACQTNICNPHASLASLQRRQKVVHQDPWPRVRSQRGRAFWGSQGSPFLLPLLDQGSARSAWPDRTPSFLSFSSTPTH